MSDQPFLSRLVWNLTNIIPPRCVKSEDKKGIKGRACIRLKFDYLQSARKKRLFSTLLWEIAQWRIMFVMTFFSGKRKEFWRNVWAIFVPWLFSTLNGSWKLVLAKWHIVIWDMSWSWSRKYNDFIPMLYVLSGVQCYSRAVLNFE